MNTSFSSFFSNLPRGRRLGRAIRHRWPALAVATVAAVMPLGVALASNLQTYGPSNFLSGISISPTESYFCLDTQLDPGNGCPAIRAFAYGDNSTGIHAYSSSGPAGLVAETSGSGAGVKATSKNGNAVVAQASRQAGTFAAGVQAVGDEAVVARGTTSGIDATAKGTAVSGISDDEYGGLFGGKQAPLRLFPASTAGAPTAGSHRKGEFYIDSQGQLFLCIADSVNGNAGTWKHVHLDN